MAAARGSQLCDNLGMAKRQGNPLRLFWICFGSLWLIGLLVVGKPAVQGMATSVAADRWPRVLGTVTEVELKKNDGYRNTLKTNYSVWVRYQYSVGRRQYTSDRIRPLWSLGGNVAALDVAARFPKGSDIEVAVNPADPAEAYLQTGFRWSDAAVLAALLPAVAMLGVAGAGVFRRTPHGAYWVGPFLAYTEPRPRLVALWASASQIGLIWAVAVGTVGALMMFPTLSFTSAWNGQTAIPPGVNPGAGDFPVMVLLLPLATTAAAFVGWHRRKLQERGREHEIVIEPELDRMLFAKSRSKARTSRRLSDIERLQIFVIRNSAKQFGHTEYELWVKTSVDVAERAVTCLSMRDADEVAGWITQNLRAGGLPTPPLEIIKKIAVRS